MQTSEAETLSRQRADALLAENARLQLDAQWAGAPPSWLTRNNRDGRLTAMYVQLFLGGDLA